MKISLEPDTAANEMTTSIRFTFALALAAAPGCIKTFDLDGADSGSTSTGGASSDPTTTAGSSMSSTTQVPDDDTTTLGGGTDPDEESSTTLFDPTGDDTSTGEAMASICDPQPEAFVGEIHLAWPKNTEAEVSVDATCTVTEVEQVDPAFAIVRLSCAEEGGPTQHEVEIRAQPFVMPPLVVDQTVRLLAELAVFVDFAGWEHVAIRDEADALVLGTFDFRQQPDGVDTHPWFAPFELSLDVDVCEPEEFEKVEPGSFLIDPCGEHIERAAVALDSPWGQALVYDRSTATLGAYEVRVPTAQTTIPHGDDEVCTDQPYPEGDLVFIRTR